MKTTKLMAGVLAAAALSLSSAMAITTSGFGDIPGAGADPYAGDGIPTENSVWTQVSGLPGGDILTLSLSATQYKSNPAPTNDGEDTFNVATGKTPLGSGGSLRSVWNWDFYGRSDANLLQQYTFNLTIDSLVTGETLSFNPTIIGDNEGAPSAFGNSHSLDFFPYNVLLGYDAYADNTFDFTLEALQGGQVVGSTSMRVITGNGGQAVPDAGSTAALLGFAVAGLGFMRRKK